MCSEKLSVSSVPTLSRNPRNPVDPAAVPPSCTVPSGAWCRTDSRSRVTSSESGLAIAAMLRLLPTASPTPHFIAIPVSQLPNFARQACPDSCENYHLNGYTQPSGQYAANYLFGGVMLRRMVSSSERDCAPTRRLIRATWCSTVLAEM